MTYVLAARCKDGVVIIADRKFTIDGGSDFVYDDKLVNGLAGIILGFSGSLGTFELFRTEILEYIQAATTAGKVISLKKFMLQVSSVVYGLMERYGRTFDVIMGIGHPNMTSSALRYYFPDGRMEIIKKFKATGSGWPFGSIFLKQISKGELTGFSMEQVAEIGYFIIKYIEHFQLEQTVGVGKLDPQIWLLPDGKIDYLLHEKPALLKAIKKRSNNRLKKHGKEIAALFSDLKR